uniref:Uncharacterized protein n=1 Tax=Rhizophora mucronata TaxID=61149 RepID=A0A2P2LD32_RHIMU
MTNFCRPAEKVSMVRLSNGCLCGWQVNEGLKVAYYQYYLQK